MLPCNINWNVIKMVRFIRYLKRILTHFSCDSVVIRRNSEKTVFISTKHSFMMLKRDMRTSSSEGVLKLVKNATKTGALCWWDFGLIASSHTTHILLFLNDLCQLAKGVCLFGWKTSKWICVCIILGFYALNLPPIEV